jgi:hypothetical protein
VQFEELIEEIRRRINFGSACYYSVRITVTVPIFYSHYNQYDILKIYLQSL